MPSLSNPQPPPGSAIQVARRDGQIEYPGKTDRVSVLVYLFLELVYLFLDDRGVMIEVVFTVKASRYAALRPQLEAIEGGGS